MKNLLNLAGRNSNATGNPALTINAGFSATEPPLPIGMMMIGRDFEDATVLHTPTSVYATRHPRTLPWKRAFTPP